MASLHPSSVTELFCHDHRRLDAILLEVKRCAAEGDFARAAERFADFRGGLERHIAAEEEILFPAFERATGIHGGGPTEVMRIEHREIKERMAGVAASLASETGEDRLALLAVLSGLLASHNAKEEHILYPASDRVIQAEALLSELEHRIDPL